METDEQHGRLGRLFAALVGADQPEATPAEEAGEAAPDAPRSSRLDLEKLSHDLSSSHDPARVLRDFVSDVRHRSAAADAELVTRMPGRRDPAPSAFETYLAERLQEAGVLEEDGVYLPSLRVVRPRSSGLFYLRVEEPEIPWLSKVKVLRVEAALNAALLAEEGLEDANSASLEELVRYEGRCARSIVAQAPLLAERRESPARGEWAVRRAISDGIEELRLPYRLTARFRVNEAAGRAAIEFDVVPPRAWWATAWADGLSVVGATAEMRRRSASEYNLRVGVLLAAYALLVAPFVDEVHVAGVEDSSAGHACYLSARITRAQLEGIDLRGAVDPWRVMHAAGATVDERNLTLSPVRQGFSLDDEQFCPARRFDAVELSQSALGPEFAHEFGCETLRDLGIDEAAARRAATTELVRGLGDTTEQNVRALLSIAGEDAPDDVREAALRCVHELIEGTLEDDPLAIVEAFVAGGPLERGVARAREAFLARDAEDAERRAREALGSLGPLTEEAADQGAVPARAFGDYADRVIYNRLVAESDARCRLVPDALLEGHLIVSACALARGDATEALSHARLARELAPLSTQASLHLSQCLEATGDVRGAENELRRLLTLAHDPETIGLAYLRMAQYQWQSGHVLAAQACYQLACARLGAPVLVAGLAVVALLGRVGEASGSALTQEQVEAALAAESIPFAPTEEVGAVLMEAAGASVDAERFGVARDVLRSLCSILRDDALFGVLRSIEDEPDR